MVADGESGCAVLPSLRVGSGGVVAVQEGRGGGTQEVFARLDKRPPAQCRSP